MGRVAMYTGDLPPVQGIAFKPMTVLSATRAGSGSLGKHQANQQVGHEARVGTLRAISVFMRTTQSRPLVMVKQGAHSVDEIAETILGYVTSCPDAADTIDGICEWWIPRQRYLQAKSAVLAALELLKEREQIDTSTGSDGRVLYRARRSSTS